MKFLVELFTKSSWCPEATPLGALEECEILELNLFNSYRQAHFRGYGPLLQVKRGP